MTDGKYILNNKGEPVLEPDLITWAKWFENSLEQRRVGFDEVGNYAILTVFLSMNYSIIYPGSADERPILYETIVFRPVTKEEIEEDQKIKKEEYRSDWKEGDVKEDDSFELRRYHTKQEAEAGHKEMVELVKQKHGN